MTNVTDARRMAELLVPPTWAVEGPVRASSGYGRVVRARATSTASPEDLAGVSAWGKNSLAAWGDLARRLRSPRPAPLERIDGPWNSYALWREDSYIGAGEVTSDAVDEAALHAAYEAARGVLPPGWYVSDLSTNYFVPGQTPGVWYAAATAPYLRLGDDSELDSRGAWGDDPLCALRALAARFARP